MRLELHNRPEINRTQVYIPYPYTIQGLLEYHRYIRINVEANVFRGHSRDLPDRNVNFTCECTVVEYFTSENTVQDIYLRITAAGYKEEGIDNQLEAAKR